MGGDINNIDSNPIATDDDIGPAKAAPKIAKDTYIAKDQIIIINALYLLASSFFNKDPNPKIPAIIKNIIANCATIGTLPIVFSKVLVIVENKAINGLPTNAKK